MLCSCARVGDADIAGCIRVVDLELSSILLDSDQFFACLWTDCLWTAHKRAQTQSWPNKLGQQTEDFFKCGIANIIFLQDSGQWV